MFLKIPLAVRCYSRGKREGKQMSRYKIVFTKRLCNDIGRQHNCVQAIIDVGLARSASRAAQAAQKRFERKRRIPDWQLAADAFEIKEENAAAH